MSLRGKTFKSQSPCPLRFIHPYQFALDLDSVVMLAKPEMDCLIPVNGSDGVKAKSTFGNIQHAAPVTGLDIDVSESI